MTIKTTIGELSNSIAALQALGSLNNLPKELKIDVSNLLIECQKKLDEYLNKTEIQLDHAGLELENLAEYLPTPQHIMALALFKKS
jgi:hypothetical protein